jgi:hypothetical protein
MLMLSKRGTFDKACGSLALQSGIRTLESAKVNEQYLSNQTGLSEEDEMKKSAFIKHACLIPKAKSSKTGIR